VPTSCVAGISCHATLAALCTQHANPLFNTATQADKLVKQGCKAHIVLATAHQRTGTAYTLCVSADVSGRVTAQGLDPDRLAALLDEKLMVIQSAPAGLPPDRGV
jgi:hypothetical protein